MTKQRKTYKTYTREFKLEAVRLMQETDRRAAEKNRCQRAIVSNICEYLALVFHLVFGGWAAGLPEPSLTACFLLD